MGTSLISKDACLEGEGVFYLTGHCEPQGKGTQLFSPTFSLTLPLQHPAPPGPWGLNGVYYLGEFS